jgi:hypothetical protein
MNEFDVTRDKDWPGMVRAIKESSLPEVEKLARAFRWITSRIIEHAQEGIEAARAIKDEEELVKQQVKIEATKHARAIFQNCHQLATGRKAWDEKD